MQLKCSLLYDVSLHNHYDLMREELPEKDATACLNRYHQIFFVTRISSKRGVPIRRSCSSFAQSLNDCIEVAVGDSEHRARPARCLGGFSGPESPDADGYDPPRL